MAALTASGTAARLGDTGTERLLADALGLDALLGDLLLYAAEVCSTWESEPRAKAFANALAE